MYGTRCLVRTTCPYPYELPPFLIVKLKKFFPFLKLWVQNADLRLCSLSGAQGRKECLGSSRGERIRQADSNGV